MQITLNKYLHLPATLARKNMYVYISVRSRQTRGTSEISSKFLRSHLRRIFWHYPCKLHVVGSTHIFYTLAAAAVSIFCRVAWKKVFFPFRVTLHAKKYNISAAFTWGIQWMERVQKACVYVRTTYVPRLGSTERRVELVVCFVQLFFYLNELDSK